MFNWFNNIRMGFKLLIAFITLAVLVGGVLGGLSYYQQEPTDHAYAASKGDLT